VLRLVARRSRNTELLACFGLLLKISLKFEIINNKQTQIVI
jgi:hypothetical protein